MFAQSWYDNWMSVNYDNELLCIRQNILFTTRKSSTGWAARRGGTKLGKRRKRLKPRSTQVSREQATQDD